MSNVNNVNINVQCECYHRRGLLYYANPLAWGRPCRRCRRMMSRNNIVVTVPAGQVACPVQTTATTVMPAQCATHWQSQQQSQTMSALPPKYDQAVAAN
ncbi:uncharacterized protein LOC6541565 [Drosophila erecta]|uniref:Uncharacterized protein n=1 Tax=Drosophila erecta TaxID=7220 RepID=B3N3N7_DROER|nr:uncharacterized protein LOC6541565 [Drosophila erecta]EDV57696.2 uncharacterized protein Dere_GG24979 [Drosophila erecta]